jgi:phage gp36-like protein
MHKCRSTAANNQSKQPLTAIPTTTITTTDSIAYRNFVNTCTSAKTRKDYERSLHYYISYLSLELELGITDEEEE